jgi:hypothetical protein
LIRCNLTPAQEAAAISRHKAIYEELDPETKRGGEAIKRKTFPFDLLPTRPPKRLEKPTAPSEWLLLVAKPSATT